MQRTPVRSHRTTAPAVRGAVPAVDLRTDETDQPGDPVDIVVPHDRAGVRQGDQRRQRAGVDHVEVEVVGRVSLGGADCERREHGRGASPVGSVDQQAAIDSGLPPPDLLTLLIGQVDQRERHTAAGMFGGEATRVDDVRERFWAEPPRSGLLDRDRGGRDLDDEPREVVADAVRNRTPSRLRRRRSSRA